MRSGRLHPLAEHDLFRVKTRVCTAEAKAAQLLRIPEHNLFRIKTLLAAAFDPRLRWADLSATERRMHSLCRADAPMFSIRRSCAALASAVQTRA